MKKTLKDILRKVIIIIYKAVKSVRRTFKTKKIKQNRRTVSANEIAGKSAIVGTKHKKSKAAALRKQNSVVSNNPTRHKSKKTVWWKNRRVIAAAIAGVSVVSLIMVFALQSKPDTSQKLMSAALTDIKSSTEVNTENNDLVEDKTTNSTSKENQSVEVASINQTDINKQGASVDTEIKQLPTPTPIATTAPEEQPLTPGCNDARIIDIQQRLMDLGYMGMDEPTDYYGFVTEYSLQLFQRKHSLQVDGILGDVTLEKLFDEDALPYTVKLGDDGTDVASIQERLQDLRYLKAKSTGYFGTDTEAAVKRFQKRNGLHIDGNVGENTREVLFSEGAKAERKSSSSSGGSSSGGSSSGSGGGSSGPIAVGDPDKASADALVDYALTQLGKKYVRGGKGPNVFDCSGFVYYCLNKVGYKIGYMTSGGWGKSSLPKVTNMKDMKKGDIICFKGHVGIYMGNGKMVDASSSNGKIVTRSNIFNSKYWTRNFICARRVF